MLLKNAKLKGERKKFFDLGRKTFLTLALGLCVSANAFAVGVNTLREEDDPRNSLKPWGLGFEISRESNLRVEGSQEVIESTSLLLAPRYVISKNWTTSAFAIFSQTLTTPKEFSMSDVSVRLGYRPWTISENIKFSAQGAAILPANKESQLDNELRGGLESLNTLIFNNQAFGLPVASTLSLRFLKLFHKFDKSVNQAPLTSYRARLSGTSQISFGDRVSFGVFGFYQAGRTYEDALRSGFFHSERLAYSLTPAYKVFVSHANSGSPLLANGSDWDVDFYDQAQSVFSIGLEGAF